MKRQTTIHLLALILSIVCIAAAAAQQQGTRPSRTAFAPSEKQVTEGTSVSLFGIVSPLPEEEGTPTGSVEFFDGTTSLGAADLASVEGRMQATVAISLPVGAHSITVKYSGDSTFRSSISVPELLIVVAGQ